ncbi:MAG: Flp pilus assembly protein CpaB, partial [Waddliaceae bacterium]
MGKDRLVFLISVALLGLLTAFLFRHQDNREIPKEQKKETVEKQVKEQIVQVMVAQQKLHVGDRLMPNTYKWEELASGDPDPTLIIRDPKIEKWLNDAEAIREIPKGSKVKRLDIMWPQEGEDTNAVIVLPAEDGKSGVLFHIDEGPPIARFMSPGMFVDVIFTSKPDIGLGTVTATLLKNIRVLSTGTNDQGPGYASSSKKEVNILLEMTDKEAEIFSYAEQAGTLTLRIIQSGEPRSTENDELGKLLLTSKSSNNFYSLLTTNMIRSLFPNVDITITATKKGYIASGRIPEPQIAVKIREILEKLADDGEKDVVDIMEVVPQQVLLCVRILEVVKEVKGRIGVNWQALYQSGTEQVALAAIFPRPLGSATAFALPAGSASTSVDPNYFADSRGIEVGSWTLSAVLDLLKEKGCGRILAEPNLTTISGKTGYFFVGGEFPILIPQGGSLVGTVTVEYKKFGVILEFTPTVDTNGLITLHIVPEVSSIDQQNSVKLQGFDIPALTTRRADTTVKLWPGQCYAIAGLLQHDKVAKVYSL